MYDYDDYALRPPLTLQRCCGLFANRVQELPERCANTAREPEERRKALFVTGILSSLAIMVTGFVLAANAANTDDTFQNSLPAIGVIGVGFLCFLVTLRMAQQSSENTPRQPLVRQPLSPMIPRAARAAGAAGEAKNYGATAETARPIPGAASLQVRTP